MVQSIVRVAAPVRHALEVQSGQRRLAHEAVARRHQRRARRGPGGQREHGAVRHPLMMGSQPPPSDQESTTKDAGRAADRWSDWLRSRRQGGVLLQPDQSAELLRYRDGVLGGAELEPNDVVLDVGCGDGLIGFGAFEALGDAVHVVFSDVSADVLATCKERATEMGVSDRCSYVRVGAEDLAEIGDASVDVVTTRSVLIYVSAKRRTFAEFFRALRPGGRLSMLEPINRRMFPEPQDLFWGWNVSSVMELRDRVVAEFARSAAPESQAMLDFDENDLVRLAQEVGFQPVELNLHISVARPPQRTWQRLLHSSPNPLAPTLLEAVSASLDTRESTVFLNALRASVEAGIGRNHLAVAYLRARRT